MTGGLRGFNCKIYRYTLPIEASATCDCAKHAQNKCSRQGSNLRPLAYSCTTHGHRDKLIRRDWATKSLHHIYIIYMEFEPTHKITEVKLKNRARAFKTKGLISFYIYIYSVEGFEPAQPSGPNDFKSIASLIKAKSLIKYCSSGNRTHDLALNSRALPTRPWLLLMSLSESVCVCVCIQRERNRTRVVAGFMIPVPQHAYGWELYSVIPWWKHQIPSELCN